MADTKHTQTGLTPVEGDGISYRGLVWFVVVMAITMLVCNGLMVGAFKLFDHQVTSADPGRPPLAVPAGQAPPAPNLLYLETGALQLSEQGNLSEFRQKESADLGGYAYDKVTGVARVPIDKAKDLLLQRGLPARDTATTPAAPAKKGEPAAPGKIQ